LVVTEANAYGTVVIAVAVEPPAKEAARMSVQPGRNSAAFLIVGGEDHETA
jgi:hypothetical protein